MAFSPDGRVLATGGEDDLVRLWEVETGRPLQELEGHGGTVTAVAFSRDGRWMATGSGDTTVKLWERVAPGR